MDGSGGWIRRVGVEPVLVGEGLSQYVAYRLGNVQNCAEVKGCVRSRAGAGW